MGDSDPKESFADLFESSAGAGRDKRSRRLSRGERLEVKVVAIGRDAVFVDVGEKQEGFIERAELVASDGMLMAKVGSSISAVVVDTDGERVRFSPVVVRRESEISTIDDGGEVVAIPKAKAGPLLLEGARIRGTVTGVERYGVFVQIEGTHGGKGRGLVPTAETGTPRGADLKKHFATGSLIEAKILSIAEDGKFRLSVKALAEDDERREFQAYAAKQEGAAKQEAGAPQKPGAAPKKEQIKNFGTLGDLLSKAKK
ncbi:MAG: S1 RNA-binding domain-containing protein [Polyangiaceae bacterium]|nr:S1 RNA-binding domain-containing protein [Polyangiaceae bacterium]